MEVLPTTQLFERLTKIANRYLRYQGEFDAFCTNTAWLADVSEKTHIPGLLHTFDQQAHRLTLKFCGRTFWIDFKMRHKEGKGEVRFCDAPSKPTDEPHLTKSFTFDSRGLTEIKSASDDLMSISDPTDSSELLLTLLLESLDKDPK